MEEVDQGIHLVRMDHDVVPAIPTVLVVRAMVAVGYQQATKYLVRWILQDQASIHVTDLFYTSRETIHVTGFLWLVTWPCGPGQFWSLLF